MGKIAPLPEEVILKIAAGEVIERPASVIKELIENALDAGATQITIAIEETGKRLIRVIDNGSGMEEDDVPISLLRHTTSKIQKAEDLFSLHTLGFRGEALASIAAVSHFSLITRTPQALRGIQLQAVGGVVQGITVIGAAQGTTIEVRDLFFNTPARKKFLKTDAVELQHIMDRVTQYAILHPKIAFTLLSERNTLLQIPAVHTVREKIASLYGTVLAKSLLEVQSTALGISLTGLIAPPSEARSDKEFQSFFVNQRWIKSEDISQAVQGAFHSLLFAHKYPLAFLFLTIDPKQIDVNVHPQKMQVKFAQKELVVQTVALAIHETLRNNRLIPETSLLGEQLTFGWTPTKKKYAFETSTQELLVQSSKELSSYTSSLQGSASLAAHTVSSSLSPSLSLSLSLSLSPSFSPSPALFSATSEQPPSKLPSLKLLGQIHKTFFVAETEGGILFLDQHAVHERILYEQLLEEFVSKSPQVQELLQGELLELAPKEAVLMNDHREEFRALGFSLEEFGRNTILLKTIPSVLGRTQSSAVLREILSALQEEQKSILAMKEKIITRMACRAAIMAGEEVSLERMRSLVDTLGQCRLPFTCPHGRPTMIKTEAEELEKKFKRK